MGQLISGFRNGEAIVPELSFDLENAIPTNEEELQVYHRFENALIKPGPNLLKLLKKYIPASEQIRQAITHPTPDNETTAWDAVTPTVDILRDIYEYSTQLEENLPKLLNILCEGDVNKNLERNQGLAKLFAELLDFVFEFDHLKMQSPSMQNDFSYYRRMLQRGRHSSRQPNLRSAMIEDDQANRISLFIAYPTPMLKCLIETTTLFVNNNNLQKSVSDWLAALWSTCFHAVSKKREHSDMSSFCMKVMVVSIILYDHIDINGAFYKNSPINIKNSVKAIQTITNISLTNEYIAANLLSALRYNSKHLNDETTPKGVRNLVLAV